MGRSSTPGRSSPLRGSKASAPNWLSTARTDLEPIPRSSGSGRSTASSSRARSPLRWRGDPAELVEEVRDEDHLVLTDLGLLRNGYDREALAVRMRVEPGKTRPRRDPSRRPRSRFLGPKGVSQNGVRGYPDLLSRPE